MKHYIHTLFSFFLIFSFSSCLVYADEECDAALAEGKAAYNKKAYSQAKALFDNVIAWCGESYSDVSSWKRKCVEALNPLNPVQSTVAKLTVSDTSISATSDGLTKYITVNSNKDWEIQYPSGSMYSTTREGNSVKVVINSNSNNSSRNDYFNIKTVDGTKIVKISLYQDAYVSAPYLTVSKTSISASSSGTTEYLTVDCNTEWEIQYPSATMYTATRNGNQVKVVIKANTESEARNDYFNIRTVDQKKTIKISLSQNAGYSSLKTAKINRVWVDHNVYSGNQKGMKIHVHFEVEGMKGKTGQVSAYFYFDNGTALNDYNGSYKTTDGKVAVSGNYSPRYDSSEYSDFTIFMPVSELHCSSKGTYNLKFSVSIWSDDKRELTQSSYTSFTLTN